MAILIVARFTSAKFPAKDIIHAWNDRRMRWIKLQEGLAGRPTWLAAVDAIMRAGKSGYVEVTDAKLDTAWTYYTSVSGVSEPANHTLTLSDRMKKSYLVVPVDDFNDATMNDYEAVEYVDPNAEDQVVSRHRKYTSDWETTYKQDDGSALSAKSINDIKDPTKALDFQVFNPQSRAGIVALKP